MRISLNSNNPWKTEGTVLDLQRKVITAVELKELELEDIFNDDDHLGVGDNGDPELLGGTGNGQHAP